MCRCIQNNPADTFSGSLLFDTLLSAQLVSFAQNLSEPTRNEPFVDST